MPNHMDDCEPSTNWQTMKWLCIGVLLAVFVENVCHASTCDQLRAPNNGHVSLSTPSVTIGTVANYSCNENYTLIGDYLRTCLSNASWSGIVPACTRIYCSFPGLPLNSFYNSSNEEVNATFPHGTVITFTCFQGYTLEGSKSSVCTANSNWSSAMPTCSKGSVDNRTGGKEKTTSTEGQAGTSTHVTWLPTAGSTTHIKCPVLHVNRGLVRQLNGSFVMFVCDTGFQLVGSALIECWINGTWSRPPPVCVAEAHTDETQETTTDSNSTSAATSLPITELNASRTEMPFSWKKFFMKTRYWLGTFNSASRQQRFKFVIIDITPDTYSSVKAVFSTKDSRFEVEGNIKANTSATILFESVRSSHMVSTTPLYRQLSLEGQVYSHNGDIVYTGQICSQLGGCEEFTMKPSQDDETSGFDDFDASSHGLTLVLGVVIPVTFFIVALVTAALICRRRGRGKYGANGTLTSFENPVYDYEQSLR